MKLQILIPHYTETEDIVKPLLDSLAVQQGVSFNEIGIILCNDGTGLQLPYELLNSYPYDIQCYLEPHRGVSGTRNACLDYATADYVMFCDADDMFFNAFGCWIIFQEMDKGFDCLVSRFVEESRNPENKEEMAYIYRDNDYTFVHGKVFRREWLIENNIRFCERLTIHEDGYFNRLAQTISDRTVYVDTAFYLWKWRQDSVCRRDPKYLLRTYPNLLASNEALINELSIRGLEHEADSLAACFMLDTYYNLNRPYWIEEENREFLETAENEFAAYYRRNLERIERVPKDEQIRCTNEIRQKHVSEGMHMERMTLSEWLHHIERLNENVQSIENGNKKEREPWKKKLIPLTKLSL